MTKDIHIRKDLFGHPFNGMFPPTDKESDIYSGYSTPAQECLFYDFAVQGYDLKIKYNGNYYYFMVDTDCVWLSDKSFTEKKKKFKNGNDVLKNFIINGKPLYQLTDKLEEYEPM